MFDYILTTRSLEREATIKLAHFISLYCCSWMGLQQTNSHEKLRNLCTPWLDDVVFKHMNPNIANMCVIIETCLSQILKHLIILFPQNVDVQTFKNLPNLWKYGNTSLLHWIIIQNHYHKQSQSSTWN
jgi:hypothetical protein